MPQRLRFTKASVEKLAPQDGQERTYFFDDAVPALSVCVSSTGRRTFYLVRRVDKRPTRIKIGPFPEVTIEQARRKAQELNGKIAVGENPQAARKTKQASELSFGELFAWYMEAHARPRKKTWADDEKRYERVLKHWAKRPMSSITRSDVAALHVKLKEERGLYSANRTLSLIHGVYERAAEELDYAGVNPARRVRMFHEEPRDRFLSKEELRRFFAALGRSRPDFADFTLLCLFTGARRSNVAGAKWDQFDVENAVWRIPAAASKNGRSMVLPLSTAALQVLERRALATGGREWLFPSHSRAGHFRDPTKAWRTLMRRAGISGLRLHDLRRSLGAMQASQNANLAIIGRSLGHAAGSSVTGKVYSPLQIEDVRASVERATAAMLELREEVDGGKVE